MCGRFTLKSTPRQLATQFGVPIEGTLEPRYNVAPAQQILAVRHPSDRGQREFAFLEWGLVPSWADEPVIGQRLINARAETVASKPSFRAPFRTRRCLVVAD